MERSSNNVVDKEDAFDMRSATAQRLILFLWLAANTWTQPAPNPLVGAWHNITSDPKFPQALLIFSADGYYAEVAVPPGRSMPKNDFDRRTREELMKQFGGVRASYGTWKAEGNKLIRLRLASEDPGIEGTQTVNDFRFEADILILTRQNGQSGGRFRRMK
jgi:hypothetical protein